MFPNPIDELLHSSVDARRSDPGATLSPGHDPDLNGAEFIPRGLYPSPQRTAGIAAAGIFPAEHVLQFVGYHVLLMRPLGVNRLENI